MRGLWIAGAMLIACSALSDSAPQQQKTEGASSTNSVLKDNQKQSGNPSTISVDVSGHLDVTPADQQGSNQAEKQRWWERPSITDWMIALFALAAVVAGALQWDSMRRQIKLAREEFIATHRPKIILREVNFVEGEIIYSLVNIGGSNAIIFESWFFAETLVIERGMRNPISTGHNDLGKKEFAPGQTREFTLPNADDSTFFMNFPNSRRIGGDTGGPFGDTYFVGAVLYADDLGNLRRSVFRRRWDDSKKGFYRTDNPEHEYAD